MVRAEPVHAVMVEVLSEANLIVEQPIERLQELTPMKSWDKDKQDIMDVRKLLVRGDGVYGYMKDNSFREVKPKLAEGKRPAVSLTYRGTSKSLRVADAVAASFLGASEKDIVVFLNGNASDARVTNLCLVQPVALRLAYMQWLKKRAPGKKIVLLDWPGSLPLYIANTDDGCVFSTELMDMMTTIERKDGYMALPIRMENGTTDTIQMQRLIAFARDGHIPDKHHIDHLNHDTSDNRSKNLKCVPANENMSRRRSAAHPSNRALGGAHPALADPADVNPSAWFCIGKCAKYDLRAYEISAYSSNARRRGSSKLLSRYLQFSDNAYYYSYKFTDANTNKPVSIDVHRAMARAIELPIGLGWPQSSENSSSATPDTHSSTPVAASPSTSSPATAKVLTFKQPTLAQLWALRTTKAAAVEVEVEVLAADIRDVEVAPLAPQMMKPTDMEVSRTPLPRPQKRFNELAAQFIVDHIDGDSKNNTWTNLRWLRQQENVAAALGVSVRIIDTTTNEWQDYPCRTDAAKSLNFKGLRSLIGDTTAVAHCDIEWKGIMRPHVAILLLDNNHEPRYTGDPAMISTAKGFIFRLEDANDETRSMLLYSGVRVKQLLHLGGSSKPLPIKDESALFRCEMFMGKPNCTVKVTRLT